MHPIHTGIVDMPLEILAHIFNDLGPKELARLSAASRSLCQVSEMAWSKLCKQLACRPTKELKSYRISFFEVCRNLNQNGQQGALLLDKPVKTAQEFDFFYVEFKTQPQKIAKLTGEVADKLEWHDVILKGFLAREQLKKVNLLSLEDAEKQRQFASVLQAKYGSDKAYITLAENCIRRKECQTALKILNENLSQSHKREFIIMNLAFHYSKFHDIDTAINFLKSQTYDSKNGDIEEATNYLIELCYEKKEFAAAEKIIDNLNIKNRLCNIHTLVSEVLESNQLEEAKRLFFKYPLPELDLSNRGNLILLDMYKKLQKELQITRVS